MAPAGSQWPHSGSAGPCGTQRAMAGLDVPPQPLPCRPRSQAAAHALTRAGTDAHRALGAELCVLKCCPATAQKWGREGSGPGGPPTRSCRGLWGLSSSRGCGAFLLLEGGGAM